MKRMLLPAAAVVVLLGTFIPTVDSLGESCFVYLDTPKAEFGGASRPFNEFTKEGVCHGYAANSCCSSKFINGAFYNSLAVETEGLSPTCKATFQGFSCGLSCSPKQHRIVSLDERGQFEARICEATCVSLYLNCKENLEQLLSAFTPDDRSEAMLDDDQTPRDPHLVAAHPQVRDAVELCAYMGRSTEGSGRVTIQKETNEDCFLFDNVRPTIVSTLPVHLTADEPASLQILRIHFSEGMKPGHGHIRILRAAKAGADGGEEQQVVASIAPNDPWRVSFSQTDFPMDTVVVFLPYCVLEPQQTYQVVMGAEVFVDAAGNGNEQLAAGEWEFTTSADKCEPGGHHLSGPPRIFSIVLLLGVLGLCGGAYLYRNLILEGMAPHQVESAEQLAEKEGEVVNTNSGAMQVRLVPVFNENNSNPAVPPSSALSTSYLPVNTGSAENEILGAGLLGDHTSADVEI